MNIFDVYCDGAAIIGGPRLLHSAIPTPRRTAGPQKSISGEEIRREQTIAAQGRLKRMSGRVVAVLKRKI